MCADPGGLWTRVLTLVLSSTLKGNPCAGKGFGTEGHSAGAAPQQIPVRLVTIARWFQHRLFPQRGELSLGSWAPSCQRSLEFSKSQLLEINFSVSGNTVRLIKPHTWRMLRTLYYHSTATHDQMCARLHPASLKTSAFITQNPERLLFHLVPQQTKHPTDTENGQRSKKAPEKPTQPKRSPCSVSNDSKNLSLRKATVSPCFVLSLSKIHFKIPWPFEILLLL